jgi:hypothetical protein
MCGSRHTFSRTETKYFVGATEIPANQLREIPGYRFAELFPHRREGFTLKYGVKPVQIPDRDRIPVAQQKEDHLATLGHWKHRRVERGEMTEAQYAAEMAAAEKNWSPSSAFAYLVTNATPPQAIDRVIKWERKEKQTMCGAKCRNARGPNCDCICEGKYHGAGMTNSRTRFAASDLDFKPTAEMAANAARGLELREKHGKGGTAVGVARARDIKNRANLSPDTVKRMHSFFSRHEGNQAGGEDDAGYIAWLLWGGDAGKAWAARKAAQIDKSESARGAARKASMAKFKVGDRIAYKPFPAETAGEIVEIRAPEPLGDIQRRRAGQRLEVEYGVRQSGGAIMWIDEGMAVKASRPGAKAAFAANSVDLWNFLSRNDTRITRQNKNDLALHKKYAKMALSLPDFTPPSHAQHGPSLHTMAKDVLAEIKAWEEQVYRYRNRAPWDFSRPGAKATMARDRDVKVRKGNFTDTVAIVGQNGNESADWYAGLILRHKDGEEQVLWMKHNYKTEAAATKYAIQKFDAHVGRGGYSRPGAKATMGKREAVEDVANAMAIGSRKLQGMMQDAQSGQLSLVKRNLGWLRGFADGVEERINKFESTGFSRPGAKARFDRMAVANEILRQLGGGRFMAMVGGKNALATTVNGKNGLQVQIGRGAKNGINRLVVLLDEGSDTYDMQLWRIGQRGLSTTKVWEGDGLYAEDLARIFTDKTGFYTSFARHGKSAFSLAAVKSAAAKVAAAYGTGEDSAVIRKHLDRIVSVLSGNTEGGRREAMGIHAQIGSVAERTHGRDFMWSAPMQGLESAIRSAGQFARPGAKARFSWNSDTAHINEILNAALRSMSAGDIDKAKQMIRDAQAALFNLHDSFSRPGAKARFANWEITPTKKHGQPIEEHTAKIGGKYFKIDTMPHLGADFGSLYVWDDLRGLKPIASGRIAALKRQAEALATNDALSRIILGEFSRPGAKSTHAAPRPKFNLGDKVAIMDGGRVLDTGVIDYAYGYDDFQETYKYKVRTDAGARKTWNEGSLKKMSRPGAKARFAVKKSVSGTLVTLVPKAKGAGWKSYYAEWPSAKDARVTNHGVLVERDDGRVTLTHTSGQVVSEGTAGFGSMSAIRMSRPGAKSMHAADNMYYTVAAHIGGQPSGERTTKSLDEAKAYAKAMLAALKPSAKGKDLVVDVYPVVNYSPQASILSLKASRPGSKSNGLTLAQRIAVAHDAKRMALR